jgi:predicted component of type VI protein secretion system
MKRSIIAIAMVLLVTLAACSSSPPPSLSQQAALAKTEMHFDLKACQDLGGGLYKCPAVDRPICNPDYKGQAECVRIGAKGGVFVETPSGLASGQWILEGPGYIANP